MQQCHSEVLKNFTAQEVSSTIYHELKAHIDMEIERQGVKNAGMTSGDEQHKQYGEKYFLEKNIDPKSEAGKYRQQSYSAEHQ